MDDELDGTPGARPHLRRLLSFDCTGFVEEDRSEDRIVWRRHDADATVALEYASRSFWSDLASEETERRMSRRLRDACAEEEIGVSAVHVLEPRALHGARILRVLLKEPDPGGPGLAYEGVIVLPLAGGAALTITVAAAEGDLAGVREAAVLERLRDEMTLAVPRWVREPDGDPLGAVPWRPTHADLSKWDTLIPDHPLSVVRRILDATIASLRLAPWTEGALLPLPSPGSGWV